MGKKGGGGKTVSVGTFSFSLNIFCFVKLCYFGRTPGDGRGEFNNVFRFTVRS